MTIQNVEKIFTEIDQESKVASSLSAHSARFFNSKTLESQTEKEKSVVPFGLTFAAKTKVDPRNCSTFHSTVSQYHTPRGDTSPDVNMDIDL